MHSNRRWFAGVAMAVLTAFGVLGSGTDDAVAGGEEIYPLSKVKKGQKGYGLTTFQGTTPERFEFEVVGILKNWLPEMDLILVKSDDPKLQVSGFWQGMSGSPLYIDGKVACAFSYGFRFNKVPLGGCTPIEFMIDEGKVPLRGDDDTVVAGTAKKKTTKKAKKAKKTSSTTRNLPTQVASLEDWERLTPTSSLSEAMEALGPPRQPWLLSAPMPKAPAGKVTSGDDETMTASVPLSIAGISGDAYDTLEKIFGNYGLEPVRAGGTGGASDDGPTSFAMGASIAVELIRGDMSAAATGTVSYIDGDRVLAFGHPFFQTGETYAPVSTSEVLGVVPSALSAFVLAQPINEVGAMVQDRQSMIMADTSMRHPMVPVDVFIKSLDGKNEIKHEFHTQVWNNKFFASGLAGSVAMSAIQLYLPDRDHTTAKITSSLKLKGMKEFEFVDFLYANDGASSIVGGARALRALVPLLHNPWTPVQIESVRVDVDLTFEANYGDIKELRVPAGKLVPGKTYDVEVVLEAYGKKDWVEKVPVDIPKELAGQIVTLYVSPGDAAPLDAAPVTDLKSLAGAIRKLLPGNVWCASLFGASEGVSVKGIAVADLPASAHDKLHPATTSQHVESYRPISQTVSPAKQVINGSASTQIRIAAIEDK